MNFPADVLVNRTDDAGQLIPWDTASFHAALVAAGTEQALRSSERALDASGLVPAPVKLEALQDELARGPVALRVAALETAAKRKRQQSLVIQLHHSEQAGLVLFANDGRLGRRWVYLTGETPDQAELLAGLTALAGDKAVVFWPHGAVTQYCRDLVSTQGGHDFTLPSGNAMRLATLIYQEAKSSARREHALPVSSASDGMSHLDRLEAESVHIIREVMAQAENPVMLYSVGKDSSVMLHLARKAFYPSPPPFPLMHVDTRWKFQAMYQFRDMMAKESGMELIVHINPEGVEKDINPFDHGSALHTDVMKTQGLKQALDQHGFDVAFGGARRDEEKSRAKERVFSFRTETHRWDPKNQRPELWNLYNGYKKPGESIRVFPLSNWTELDIWEYIYREQIPIVPLYFAAERPVVERDGMLMLVDDDRMRLFPDEEIQIKRVRFRTLGCYPLTGAFESDADDLSAIVLELLQSRTSERQGRAIDTDSSGSMEKKKVEGYF
jgi:sulfate adenylyltransferase subunit 2